MANIYNLFKFLEEKKGKKIPLRAKLIHAPETLTKEDLNVEGDFYLYNKPLSSLPDNFQVERHLFLDSTKISSLPDNLTVGGNLSLEKTPLSSIPKNLKVGGVFFIGQTPLAKKYSEEQIRKMIEEKGGKVKKEIFT